MEIKSFLEYLQYEKNYSEHTRRAYGRAGAWDHVRVRHPCMEGAGVGRGRARVPLRGGGL